MQKGCPVLYRLIPGCRGTSREQPREHRGFGPRPVADAFAAPVFCDQGPIGRPGTARPMKASTQRRGYLSVWSSISAFGALRFTDSMPLIALALLS
jgi:hypothetical protein